MRYSVIFLILAALVLVLPTERVKRDEARPTPIDLVMSDEQQAVVTTWLDGAISHLQSLSPTGQLLVMATFIILIINAAIVVAYLVNSVAAILGIGLSLSLLFTLAMFAMIGWCIGWARPRRALALHLKNHAEFGPFVGRVRTMLWKRRFKRAAREHGFSAYPS